MPDVKAIVFVVDDDVSVRESLELLITSAGWRPEMFASAQDFLSRQRATVSMLSRVDRVETLADVIHPFPAFNRVLGASLEELAAKMV